MRNLRFNRLLILSSSERSGNAFQFQDKINLITATENNVGKSTLVQLIFWTLGCEFPFDTTWTNLDCKTIVEFTVNRDQYKVHRYQDRVRLIKGDEEIQRFDKITGEYARVFSEIVDFKLLLPNRQDRLEIPPPAYYFLPFYVDQKKSWTKPWDGFDKLHQYEKFKQTLVDYHTGILTPEHFRIEEERHVKQAEKKLIDESLGKFTAALEVVSKYIPKISEAVTTNEESFQAMTDEIRNVLTSLAKKQEKLLDAYATDEAEKTFLTHQKSIAVQVAEQLELDYKFSVENVEGDLLECPLCGTEHRNTAVERASMLADKQKASNQLKDIDSALKIVSNRVEKAARELTATRVEISQLHSKYLVIEDGQQTQDLTSIIESIAGRSIEDKVKTDQEAKMGQSYSTEQDLKRLRKEQRELRLKERTEEIHAFFNNTFIQYAQILKADEVNLSAIRKPTDYTKVEKEGGAAENTRVTLAYFLAIYTVVEKYGSSVLAPLVIDTPNQHEQSEPNYESILHLILNGVSTEAQIFLCAMKNPHLEQFFPNANVVELEETRLLDSEKFDIIKPEFDLFVQQELEQ